MRGPSFNERLHFLLREEAPARTKRYRQGVRNINFTKHARRYFLNGQYGKFGSKDAAEQFFKMGEAFDHLSASFKRFWVE